MHVQFVNLGSAWTSPVTASACATAVDDTISRSLPDFAFPFRLPLTDPLQVRFGLAILLAIRPDEHDPILKRHRGLTGTIVALQMAIGAGADGTQVTGTNTTTMLENNNTHIHELANRVADGKAQPDVKLVYKRVK